MSPDEKARLQSALEEWGRTPPEDRRAVHLAMRIALTTSVRVGDGGGTMAIIAASNLLDAAAPDEDP